LTDQVNALSPTKIDFSIVSNVTLFSFADPVTVRAEIQKSLNEYKEQMRASLGRDIIRSQIIALINSVYGVYKTELTSPAINTVLSENEWANCTGITINIVGSVNG